MLSGSIARAIEGSIADAGRQAGDRANLARTISEEIMKEAVKYASLTTGPVGYAVTTGAGKEAVIQFWDAVVRNAENAATAAEQDRTTQATLPLLQIGQTFRDAVGASRGTEGGSQLPFQFDEIFDTVRNR